METETNTASPLQELRDIFDLLDKFSEKIVELKSKIRGNPYRSPCFDGISHRGRRAIGLLCVSSWEELSYHHRSELAGIKNIGKLTIAELEAGLKERGLAFRDE